MKQIFRLKHLLTIAAVIVTANLSAQTTMEQVAAAYNEGVNAMAANPEIAINAFEKTIKLAGEVTDPEAETLKNNAISQIPKLYFDWAKLLAGKRDLPGAIKQLENCIAASKKYESTQYVAQAEGTIVNIYLAIGNTALTAKDYPAAIKGYDGALSYDSKNTKAYRGKVMAYQSQDMLTEMIAAADAGIGSALPADASVVADIKKVVANAYYNAAQNSAKAKDYQGVEENLLVSMKYGNITAITYYQLGLARISTNKWNDAVEALNEAIEYEDGNDADKAKYYFNLGKCYEALENSAKACESYKKALFGEFAAAAKYQIETVLKCGL